MLLQFHGVSTDCSYSLEAEMHAPHLIGCSSPSTPWTIDQSILHPWRNVLVPLYVMDPIHGLPLSHRRLFDRKHIACR